MLTIYVISMCKHMPKLSTDRIMHTSDITFYLLQDTQKYK